MIAARCRSDDLLREAGTKILPGRYWKTWNSHLVSFGQTRCDPVRPKCDGCPIARFCHSPKKRA